MDWNSVDQKPPLGVCLALLLRSNVVAKGLRIQVDGKGHWLMQRRQELGIWRGTDRFLIKGWMLEKEYFYRGLRLWALARLGNSNGSDSTCSNGDRGDRMKQGYSARDKGDSLDLSNPPYDWTAVSKPREVYRCFMTKHEARLARKASCAGPIVDSFCDVCDVRESCYNPNKESKNARMEESGH